MSDLPNGQQYDAVVIGGGPAGLQAALTLGRMARTTLLVDSGVYRNQSATHMHNFASHDGKSPGEFRAAARADVSTYDTVTTRSGTVSAVTPDDDGGGWVVQIDGAPVGARRVVLATGLRDTLPTVPGIEELWGDVVAHCPYCHGHEFSGMHVAILGSSPHVGRLALLMTRIASRITVLADGGELDEATLALLVSAGADLRADPVTGLCRSSAGATVTFASGAPEEIGGMFVATQLSQSAPFVEQLGLQMLPSGCVQVDEFGRTSRKGIYAAGDLAHLAALPMPMASVLSAASAGLLAGSAIDQDTLIEDFGLAPPV